jgi:hypothetical protein
MNEQQPASGSKEWSGQQVIGLLHLAFAALYGVWGLASMAWVRAPSSGWFGPSLLCVVLGALGLAGVGLITQKRWGQVLSMVWAALFVAMTAAYWLDYVVSPKYYSMRVARDYGTCPSYCLETMQGHAFAWKLFTTVWLAGFVTYAVVSIIVVARATPRAPTDDSRGE